MITTVTTNSATTTPMPKRNDHEPTAAVLLRGGFLHTFENDIEAELFAEDNHDNLAIMGVMKVHAHHPGPRSVCQVPKMSLADGIGEHVQASGGSTGHVGIHVSAICPNPACHGIVNVVLYDDGTYRCFECGNAWRAGDLS
jgi:hypothetical protein